MKAPRGGPVCLHSVSLPISGGPGGCSQGSPLGGVTEGGRSPTGAMPPNGGEVHAAIAGGVAMLIAMPSSDSSPVKAAEASWRNRCAAPT